MLQIDIDKDKGIAILEPNSELSESDFKAAARIIDPYIESHGGLSGIVIHVEHFPGWDSFSALLTHLEFVKEHHKKISRVAFATDSPVGGIAEKLASHFVNAKIKHFGFEQLEASKLWVSEGDLADA